MPRPPSHARYGSHAPAASGRTSADRRPPEATDWVKRTARELGADSVGVCLSDQRWLRPDGHEQVPAEHRWVVVLAVAMDRTAISLSPGPEAAAATRGGTSTERRAVRSGGSWGTRVPTAWPPARCSRLEDECAGVAPAQVRIAGSSCRRPADGQRGSEERGGGRLTRERCSVPDSRCWNPDTEHRTPRGGEG